MKRQTSEEIKIENSNNNPKFIWKKIAATVFSVAIFLFLSAQVFGYFAGSDGATSKFIGNLIGAVKTTFISEANLKEIFPLRQNSDIGNSLSSETLRFVATTAEKTKSLAKPKTATPIISGTTTSIITTTSAIASFEPTTSIERKQDLTPPVQESLVVVPPVVIISEPTPASSSVESPPSPPSKILISKIQTVGVIADDEFIEIYNTGDTNIDLSDWSLQYRGSGAASFSKKNFTNGSVIPAKGFYLIANGDYHAAGNAQMTYSFSLSGTGGTIFIVKTHDLLITGSELEVSDKLAYGKGDYLFPEGSVYIPAPAKNEILKRKMENNLPKDTDNNLTDFEIN